MQNRRGRALDAQRFRPNANVARTRPIRFEERQILTGQVVGLRTLPTNVAIGRNAANLDNWAGQDISATSGLEGTANRVEIPSVRTRRQTSDGGSPTSLD